MSKFEFNVTKTKNRSEIIHKKINEYKNISDQVYFDLKQSKNYWIDAASESFNSAASLDYNLLNSVVSSISSYQDSVDYFTDELQNIFTSKNYSSDNMDIIYDSFYIECCKSKLSNTKKFIDNSIDNFSTCIVPSEYEYMDTLNEVFSSLYYIKDDINNLVFDLNNTSNRIESLVTRCQSNVASITYNEVDNNISRGLWSLVSVMPIKDLNITNDKVNSIPSKIVKNDNTYIIKSSEEKSVVK